LNVPQIGALLQQMRSKTVAQGDRRWFPYIVILACRQALNRSVLLQNLDPNDDLLIVYQHLVFGRGM
jgi:hypothetical protein